MIAGCLRDCRGATAIEYGLLAALLAMTIIGALTFAHEAIANMFAQVAAVFSTS